MSAFSADPASSPSPSAVALFVLGMHRSGTSAVTRMLNLLGVALGAPLLEAAADNEGGFWELAPAVQHNEALLQLLGQRWEDARPLPSGWRYGAAARTVSVTLEALVRQTFAETSLWGVKDPRLCRLLPLWSAVAVATGAQPHAILVCRHPLEVARSLERRNGFTPAHAQRLWLRYMLEAERDSRNLPRAVVFYDALLADWRAVCEGISIGLGIPLMAAATPEVAAEIDAFIRPGQRHHRVEDGGGLATSTNALSPWLRSALAGFQALAAGREDEGRVLLDAVATQLATADMLFASDTDATAHIIRSRLECDLEIALRDQKIAERDAIIAQRDTLVVQRDTLVAQRDSVINHRDTVIEHLRSEIAHRDAAMQRLNHDIACRDTALAESATLLDTAQTAHAEQLATLHRDLDEVQLRHAEAMVWMQKQIDDLYHSTSWRITEPLRVLRRLIRRG